MEDLGLPACLVITHVGCRHRYDKTHNKNKNTDLILLYNLFFFSIWRSSSQRKISSLILFFVTCATNKFSKIMKSLLIFSYICSYFMFNSSNTVSYVKIQKAITYLVKNMNTCIFGNQNRIQDKTGWLRFLNRNKSFSRWTQEIPDLINWVSSR